MSQVEDEWYSEDTCHFCVIGTSGLPNPQPGIAASPASSVYLVLSTHSVLGFLELAPMSRGHIVLLPREHATRISELSSNSSAVLGYWLPIVSRGVMAGLFGSKWQANDESWNILQANGKMAGQTINHVHFHIIPRPRPEMKSVYGETRDLGEMLTFDKRREILGAELKSRVNERENEAGSLIRASLKKEILRMKLKGKIAEGDHEWDLWSMEDGKRILQL
ncbi:hypothetical protein VE03_07694 [Pseudogymnoascus sp. 23342-1-I1]|nr:hypothetical protein VE03_07694 [Pseudogymnoascus sp. 23342-1-I1]